MEAYLIVLLRTKTKVEDNTLIVEVGVRVGQDIDNIKRALKGATAIPAGATLVSGAGTVDMDASHVHFGADGALVVEFIGWSRIDGDPMFKVINGAASLGTYFVGYVVND